VKVLKRAGVCTSTLCFSKLSWRHADVSKSLMRAGSLPPARFSLGKQEFTGTAVLSVVALNVARIAVALPC
jgi:hypothetical protein